MTPRVSVLMPVLNPDPVYFPMAVESILSQTLTDWEMVIVEDPSPRSAGEMLRKYADSRIRHIANPCRTSLVFQTNRTVELASAEYIARLDADDIADPERLQLQAGFLDSHRDIAVVGCQKTVIGPTGGMLGVREYPVSHEEIVRAMHRYNAIAHPGVMMRRSHLLSAGGYRYDRFRGVEDYELWWRFLKLGTRFANHPERLLRYRIQPNQTKSRHLKEQLRGTIAVKQMYWDSSFGLGDHARLMAERALLVMPPRLVMRLFLATAYSPAKP